MAEDACPLSVRQVAKTVNGKDKKGGKKNLRQCVGSKYSVASMLYTLKATVGHASVKINLWRRAAKAIDELVAERSGPNALPPEQAASLQELKDAVEGATEAAREVERTADRLRGRLETEREKVYGKTTAKERRTTAFDLRHVPGPWEEPWKASPDKDWTSPTDGPARLLSIPFLQTKKKACIEAARVVAEKEKAFRDQTGICLTVEVVGSSQLERSSVRHQAWAESRPWTFFSHCCNLLGGHVYASHPCAACDSHTTIDVVCIRSAAFMHDLGTQFLESINGAIAAKATKRSDFPRTHWARAAVAVLNRVIYGGAKFIANEIRHKLSLEPLTRPAAEVVEAAERTTMTVVKGQPHQTAEQKKHESDKRYETRDAKTREHARRKLLVDQAHADNLLPTPGADQVSKGAVRAQLDAGLKDRDSDEEDGEEAGAAAPRGGASRQRGGRGKGKGKGKGTTRKKGKVATAFALPEHTSAGNNTDKNAELASEVRMGGVQEDRREGGVCAACLAEGVPRAFLLSNKHARKGPRICSTIRGKWRRQGGLTSSASADNLSEDNGDSASDVGA